MGTQASVTDAWRSQLMASIPDLQRQQMDLYTNAASALILQHTAAMQVAVAAGNTAAITAAAAAITSVATALDGNQPLANASGEMIQSPADTSFVASLMPTAPTVPTPRVTP